MDPPQDFFVPQRQNADSKSCSYLASPEVVAASALAGKIIGPGWYQQPEGASSVVMGEGDGVKEEERMITAEEALEKIIGQLDNVIKTAEAERDIVPEAKTTEIEILPGFPSKIEGELVFCDADNINVSYSFFSPFLVPIYHKLRDISLGPRLPEALVKEVSQF